MVTDPQMVDRIVITTMAIPHPLRTMADPIVDMVPATTQIRLYMAIILITPLQMRLTSRTVISSHTIRSVPCRMEAIGRSLGVILQTQAVKTVLSIGFKPVRKPTLEKRMDLMDLPMGHNSLVLSWKSTVRRTRIITSRLTENQCLYKMALIHTRIREAHHQSHHTGHRHPLPRILYLQKLLPNIVPWEVPDRRNHLGLLESTGPATSAEAGLRRDSARFKASMCNLISTS